MLPQYMESVREREKDYSLDEQAVAAAMNVEPTSQAEIAMIREVIDMDIEALPEVKEENQEKKEVTPKKPSWFKM